MQTYFEQKKAEAIRRKFTILLFKLTRNKHKINGFINIKERTDAFGNLVYSFYSFNFKNDYLKIFSDLKDNVTLEDIKARSDFCILFNHIGNAKKRDIKLKIHSTDFVEMTFFTVGKEMTWEDNLNLLFLDEAAIYNIEYISTKDGISPKKTLKQKFKYLFE